MKKIIFCYFIFSMNFNLCNLFSQEKTNFDNIRPISPYVAQFSKYTDIPVSEYSGIANIEIPIYEINVDGIVIPIKLRYHSSGIRVTQEASWVGLGWDLNFGSVIQYVNDNDDYGEWLGTPFSKILPDYYSSTNSPYISSFPERWQYPFYLNGLSWTPTMSINPVENKHGYWISPDAYVPVNGDNNSPRYSLFFDHTVDSEPDIFVASFFGHKLNFIREFINGSASIKILNKKGYLVTRYGSTWIITTPNGEEFHFGMKNETKTINFGNDFLGSFNNGSEKPSSITWVLSKIITKYKRVVHFNYSEGDIATSFPLLTQKYLQVNTNVIPLYAPFTKYSYFNDCMLQPNGIYENTFFSNEKNIIPFSIIFPEGKVEFLTSDRDDVLSGKKLDKIILKDHSEQLIKSFDLSYSYFNSASVGGNVYSVSHGINNNTSTLRLRLDSINQNSMLLYELKYSNIQLPAKNSYARDIWGYYNGAVSNTSFIPNFLNFGRTDYTHNSNNNLSARLDFAIAGSLIEIMYPTKGRAVFEYELNEFDNYWVPDYSTSNNIMTHGNGLRMKSISFFNGNTYSHSQYFNYSGGISLTPKNFFREYSYNVITSNFNFNEKNYYIKEFSTNSLYSANPFFSSSGVGYSNVVSKNSNTGINGYTVKTFANLSFFNNVNSVQNLFHSYSLPLLKDISKIENGSIVSEKIYNANNNLVKRDSFIYINSVSPLFYGVRIFGVSGIKVAHISFDGLHESNISRWLIGYYPIVDFESLLIKKIEEQYEVQSGNMIKNEIEFSYNSNNLINSIKTSDSKGIPIFETIQYPDIYSANNAVFTLASQNRIAEVVKRDKIKGGMWEIWHNSFKYGYANGYYGNVFLDKVTKEIRGVNGSEQFVVHHNIHYDDFANPIEIKSNDNIIKSVIWDFNLQKPIAYVANASFQDIAYTSFENFNQGNWNYTSNPNSNYYLTGTKSHNLSNSSISKSGLSLNKDYIVTFWLRNGSYVNSINASAIISRDGWTLYSHTFSGTNSLTISGQGEIDELRISPVGAQMETFTYLPLVGISSMNNANNRITYYEYDDFGRLKHVRDDQRNIIKSYDYKYNQAQY